MRYDENQAKASILNQYFSSVFTKDDNLQPPPDMGPSPYPDMSNIDIICKGIARLLNELDPSKSHGPDDVPARLLKVLAIEISLSQITLLCFPSPRYHTSSLEKGYHDGTF